MFNPSLYTLRGHEVVPCSDIATWGSWFGSHSRIVKTTELGRLFVSTVFIGISFSNPPMVFETMVFRRDGGPCGVRCKYATWNEALKGHDEVVRYLNLGA